MLFFRKPFPSLAFSGQSLPGRFSDAAEVSGSGEIKHLD
jgi:hypothetical protein